MHRQLRNIKIRKNVHSQRTQVIDSRVYFSRFDIILAVAYLSRQPTAYLGRPVTRIGVPRERTVSERLLEKPATCSYIHDLTSRSFLSRQKRISLSLFCVLFPFLFFLLLSTTFRAFSLFLSPSLSLCIPHLFPIVSRVLRTYVF